MPLKLEIISEHREILGDDAVREFREAGATIGRSLNNDWILPDPDKYISGKHATIDCKGGIYYLADISTNGVYVNDEREPIGQGNPRRLFNGDHLHFGDFEIVVSIDEGEELYIPDAPKPSVVPDNIEQLVPEEILKTGVQLLDEDEITGDEEFQNVLFGKDEPEADADEQDEQDDADIPELSAEEPIIPEPERVEITGEDMFDAFLDGLQISRAELHPSLDTAGAMRNAGEVLREFIASAEKLLESRADLKTAFRLDQTSILPRHNNPIKLSQNTNDLVKQLLVGREGEYLGPRDAVKEVCLDLLAHQEAFLDAMTEAFVEFAERFDPEELTASFDRSLGRKPLFKFMSERKYWSLYKDLYPILTEKGGGRFPQMFAEEFVKAYERLIGESLRAKHNEPLPKVELEPLDEKKYKEAMEVLKETGSTEPLDQLTGNPEKPAGAVLEDIEDLSTLNELIDFDDLASVDDGDTVLDLMNENEDEVDPADQAKA
jgi:predicted component of type VI protein secretion system